MSICSVALFISTPDTNKTDALNSDSQWLKFLENLTLGLNKALTPILKDVKDAEEAAVIVFAIVEICLMATVSTNLYRSMNAAQNKKTFKPI